MLQFKGRNSLPIVLGVTVGGISGYCLYKLLKSWRNKSSTTTVKIAIPNEYVGLIIGRRGHRIRSLEASTGASIEFDDNNTAAGTEVTCTISGRRECVMKAQSAVNEIISDEQATVSEQIVIPDHAVGSLIAFECSTFRAICNATGVQIVLDEAPETNGDSAANVQRKITLKGTLLQVASAKDCIEGIVNASQELRESLEKREPRVQSRFAVYERLGNVAAVGTSAFEVYVSAMVDPSRFWLQVVGPKAQQLDSLVQEMTEYYKVPENRNLHTLQTVEVGGLVAALFMYDERWYRAEIIALNEAGDIADLYYVDYGDTEKVSTVDLYELKVEYLQLHFQAIECFLAHIDPVDGSWAPEAIDRFEEWAHVGLWRRLSARLANYRYRERTRAQRGNSPVPGIELFDVVGDSEFNIGDELIRQGYAVRSDGDGRSSSCSSWEQF